MADLEKEIERLESGNAWEESDEVVQLTARKTLDKVIPVRLPSDKWEALRTEARELGIGPTTLARMWILERLRQSASSYRIPPSRPSTRVADAPADQLPSSA